MMAPDHPDQLVINGSFNHLKDNIFGFHIKYNSYKNNSIILFILCAVYRYCFMVGTLLMFCALLREYWLWGSVKCKK